jgi:hypothetical protein
MNENENKNSLNSNLKPFNHFKQKTIPKEKNDINIKNPKLLRTKSTLKSNFTSSKL